MTLRFVQTGFTGIVWLACPIQCSLTFRKMTSFEFKVHRKLLNMLMHLPHEPNEGGSDEQSRWSKLPVERNHHSVYTCAQLLPEIFIVVSSHSKARTDVGCSLRRPLVLFFFLIRWRAVRILRTNRLQAWINTFIKGIICLSVRLFRLCMHFNLSRASTIRT